MTKVDYTKISGEAYDWTVTRAPEKPYNYDYTKTLVYKIYLAQRVNDGKDSRVVINFEDALERIKKIDRLTLGIQKIVYLVGWQYKGHDSKYPAFHEVNEALKRDCDETARDSLLWLMDEAYKYNTVVSFHINVSDAYEDSPLWNEYLEKGFIKLGKDGLPLKGNRWDGMQSYYVSLVNEWAAGYTAKRIDELCELFPIEKAGTVHIDAFLARPDPGHGFSMEDEWAARIKVFRYFREKGIDVTSEALYYETPNSFARPTDHLIGLQPQAFHFGQTLNEYIDRPASLMCGQTASRMFKDYEGEDMAALFGGGIDIEHIMHYVDPWEKDVRGQLFFRQFRMMYLNTLEREYAKITFGKTEAFFSDNVVTNSSGMIYKNGVKIHAEGAMLLPLVGTQYGKYYFFAFNGEKHAFDVGRAFGIPDGTTFTVREMTTDGLADKAETVTVAEGVITLQTREAEIPLILE